MGSRVDFAEPKSFVRFAFLTPFLAGLSLVFRYRRATELSLSGSLVVAARKALSGRSEEVPDERLESLEIVLVGGPEIELKLNKKCFFF